MDTKTNTMINLNIKGNLAKLLATENITVEQNNVKTASFDVKNRILTLPIFNNQSGDVYDMLIAHECSHALFTPNKKWYEIADDELRSYCNVLEDTRIDHLIQKKYPGVVKNYLNGFDILNKQNFFGIKNMNINTDLMLIDKINMRSKSMNRLSLQFTKEEQVWVDRVDALKTFTDVVKLAKEMVNWQKNQIKKKKLPNFDELVKTYGDQQDENKKSENLESDQNNNQKKSNSSINQNSDDAEENDNKEINASTKSGGDKKEDEKETNASTTVGTGGDGINKLKSITDKNYEDNKQNQLVDTKHKGYEYCTLPQANLSEVVVSYKDFLKRFRDHIKKHKINNDTNKYHNWLKDSFKKFKNDNKKTVMYLVKEFEMKKAATAYKRATTDKTGVLDPLKLKDYKFSDDVFKRLSILPDSKNHGLMMLLDWSGSMSDCLYQTVEQLINLTYFCQKINIPFEVYFFSSEKDYEKTDKNFKYKANDMYQEPMFLVNIASHRMKKIELDESMTYMFHMATYYRNNYTSWRSNYDEYFSRGSDYGFPAEYHLGSTPLNEALTVAERLIPMFKKKYQIEKMTFITLTDGGANSSHNKVVDDSYTPKNPYDVDTKQNVRVASRSYERKLVIKDGKKYYTGSEDRFFMRSDLTGLLLDIIRKKHNVTNVGFYVLKGKRWETERYFGNTWGSTDKEKMLGNKRKEKWLKDLHCEYPQNGYNRYFLLNGKKMAVQSTDQGLDEINTSMKAGRIKQLFSKNMKGRITSRVLLNKFIEEVA